MDIHLQPDWQRAVGHRVEIWKDGVLCRIGTVEAVMADNSILWLSADGIALREMVVQSDGYEVFAHFLPSPDSA